MVLSRSLHWPNIPKHARCAVFTIFTCPLFFFLLFADSPKIQGPVATYTWEGNAANISCEVEAHPGASVLWFRDGLQLPSANMTNTKIYNTPTASHLEVCGPVPSLPWHKWKHERLCAFVR